ncbi:MAG: hypothetical protein WCC32_05860 [Terriglobales bacterium]
MCPQAKFILIDPAKPDPVGGFTSGNTVVVYKSTPTSPCYDGIVFNFGKPKTAGDWIVHIAGAIVAIFLVWWMLRLYVI